MSMKVAIRQVDGITILDLSGRITLGEGSITLRDSVHDALDKGSKNILLNLAQISYIDSSASESWSAPSPPSKTPAVNSSCSTSPRRSRPAPDHQALHRLRHLGQRGLRHRCLQLIHCF